MPFGEIIFVYSEIRTHADQNAVARDHHWALWD